MHVVIGDRPERLVVNADADADLLSQPFPVALGSDQVVTVQFGRQADLPVLETHLPDYPRCGIPAR